MPKVINLHNDASDQVNSMRGAKNEGYKVVIDGMQMPCLTMVDNQSDDLITLRLDDRFEIDIPKEYAKRIAWMICNAHAIGSGYSHIGAKDKNIQYAPKVVENSLLE